MAVSLRPADLRDATGRRLAHLTSAVVGNGCVLATLSSRGELERLYWPRIDWSQNLDELRLGLAADGATRWLDEEPFVWEQSYLDDASAVRTVARDRDLEVEVVDVVLPDAPVLARRIRTSARGWRLVVGCRPALDGHARGAGAYVDASRGALVFYRRDRALAVALSPAGELSCSRSVRGEAYSVLEDVEDGFLDVRTVAHRAVEGALTADLDGEAVLLCAFGSTPDQALAGLDAPAAAGFDELLAARAAGDRALLASARPTGSSDGDVETLYRRSLLTLDLLTDRTTGGIIAAPEMDDDFEHSGGYGFVWGRDMAYCVLALLAAGRRRPAAAGLRWLVRAQAPEGLWLQRHWTDGMLAPSWGLHQLDQTGAVLFAFEAGCRSLRDPLLEHELWPAMRAGADFLRGFLDPATGLPRPSVDLWEQHEGQHAYTAAAVVGGLDAAAAMAARREPARAPVYRQAAASVRDAIERELWSEPHGRYLRSLWRGRPDGDGEPVPAAWNHDLRYPNRPVASVDPRDATVDISILGLAWPFRAVDPGSPRMRATAAAVEQGLVLPDGGVMRYDGDAYAGGNPWVLASLWLGLWYRQTGDEAGYRRALGYAVARRTPTGLLPEQATPQGEPAWVVPLAWSHAMLVLAAQPELS